MKNTEVIPNWVRLTILSDETNSDTTLTSTCSTADTMNVSLTVRRQVVIKHNIDRGNIQTSGGHIRGDKNISAAGAEFTQGTETGGLRELA